MFDSPNNKMTRKYFWKQPEHIHELTYEQAYVLILMSGFEVVTETGLLPSSCFDALSIEPAVDGYAKESNFSEVKMDIENALTDEISTSFIYWFCCRKQDDIVEFEKILQVNRRFYDANKRETPKYYCSNAGMPTIIEGRVFLEVDTAGAALYGPYREYKVGTYCAHFTLMSANNEVDLKTILCTLDIVAGWDCRTIWQTEISANFLQSGDGSIDYKVPFKIEQTEMLQFRVISTGYARFLCGIEVDVHVNSDTVNL